jgi:uncharacterized protein
MIEETVGLPMTTYGRRSMQTVVPLMLLGVIAGLLSGIAGIGGGVIIVPALVFVFGMSQQQAQGTTLALLVPPIGLLGALAYYQRGYVDLRAAGLICAGFVAGSLGGASIAIHVPGAALEKVFGLVMLGIALKMIFS